MRHTLLLSLLVFSVSSQAQNEWMSMASYDANGRHHPITVANDRVRRQRWVHRTFEKSGLPQVIKAHRDKIPFRARTSEGWITEISVHPLVGEHR